MKPTVLFFLACISFFGLSAQENFLPGYIVTTSGDTVRGFVDYRNWKVNPTSIAFRQESAGSSTVYESTVIRAFSVADELYEGAFVEIETSPDKINELSYDPEFKIEKQATFLQCVIKGDKSLYYLINKEGIENFYIKQGDNYELLLYKKYTREVNYTRQVLDNKKYIGQLSQYLTGCSTLQSKVANVRYLKRELIKLFEAYYQCTGQGTNFSKKADKMKVELGVLAGITNSSMSVASRSYPWLDNADYEKSLDPSGGLYLTLVLPRNQGRFAIHNELIVARYTITGYYMDYVHEDNYTETDLKFSATQLKLNTLVRMRFPIKTIGVRLEAGMSNAHALSISAEKVNSKVFYSPPMIEKEDALNAKTYEAGLLAGIGLDYGRFSLTGRYERGSGPSKAVNTKTSLSRLYFLVGFRLSK